MIIYSLQVIEKCHLLAVENGFIFSVAYTVLLPILGRVGITGFSKKQKVDFSILPYKFYMKTVTCLKVRLHVI